MQNPEQAVAEIGEPNISLGREDRENVDDPDIPFPTLPLPGDPIYDVGPDSRVDTRRNFMMIDSLSPGDPEDRRIFQNSRVPRTILPFDHDDAWDEWRNLARDPESVEQLWRQVFGENVPPMTAYELRAIIKNVNRRLMHTWTEDTAPPCVTDCYEQARGRFWRRGRTGQWNSYTEKQYSRLLLRLGRLTVGGPGGAPSELQSDIEAVTEKQAIITEGISGLLSGIHQMQDRLFLAKYGFMLIVPDPSIEPNKTLEWLEQLLGKEGLARALDWLYYGVTNLQAGIRGQSRILAIAGPPECGKSYFIREIARQLLGGRAADAAPWLLGNTEFASELGGAELLYVDDALGDGRLASRLRTAARLKELVTAGSKSQPMHAKGKDRYYHPVWWRVAVALNDAPEALSMLPPLDEGFGDKVILLRARDTVLSKRGDRASVYIKEMENELPGLMAYLLDRGLQGSVDGRGPVAWQDPVLAGKLRETAPEYSLAGMVVEMIERRGGSGIALPIIEPTLTEIVRGLREACGERYTRLCPTDRSTRTYLGRLQADGAVSSRVIDGRTRWSLEHLDKWLQSQTADSED